MADMFSGLQEGQQFASLDAFKTALRAISVRQHWDVRMVRSNKKNVSVGCRSTPDCPFRVVCRSNKNSAPHITNINDTHTCRRDQTDQAPQSSRSEVSHVRFLLEEVPKLFDMRQKVMGQQIVDAVKRYHGHDISIRQAQRVLTKLQPRYHTRKGRSKQADSENDPRDQEAHQHLRFQEATARPEFRELEGGRDDWLQGQEFHPAILAENLSSRGDTQEPSGAHGYREMVTHQPPVTASHISDDTSYAQSVGQERLNKSVYMTHDAQQASNSTPYPPGTAQSPNNAKSRNINHHSPQKPSDDSIQGQTLLSNFKIEFKCTSCGAFNRSFLPNQGPVSGNNVPDPHNNASNHSISAGLD